METTRKYNHRIRDYIETGDFLVRTETQAAIFDLELKGQFSDGHWENSGNEAHWGPWCGAEVKVDPTVQGRRFNARRDGYRVDDKQLLDVVRGRMIGYARLAKAFGLEFARKWGRHLIEVDFNLATASYGDEPLFRIPSWWNNGPQYRDLLQDARELEPLVTAALYDKSYGIKELKADLKEIKVAMKNQLPAHVELSVAA